MDMISRENHMTSNLMEFQLYYDILYYIRLRTLEFHMSRTHAR